MSDFEDDIDDQLLELAGAGEKKRRRKSSGGGGGGGKKRRPERAESDSERELESEEEMEDPYPLEGKYKDEADRRELLAMTELKREQILEERAGQKERIQSARALADMVRQQQRGGAGEENVSRAAKRQHTARGANKEKARSLDALKAKRKAKDDSKRSKPNLSPSQTRERSNSPQDMDISDSESEDGQITKDEQEEERLLNLGMLGKKKGESKEEPDLPCVMADLEACRLTRESIAKHCLKPWFQDYVTGAWVRYLIGHEGGQPVYRICEVSNLAADLVKPYKVNEKTVNQAFELKHGKSVKVFNMDKVSNSPFTDKEYDRVVKVCAAEEVKMPTKKVLQNKAAQMQKLRDQPITNEEITVMLQRKKEMLASVSTKPAGLSAIDKSRLNQQKTLALRRQDYAEVARIEARLAEGGGSEGGGVGSARTEAMDLLAKVNERNRKANMETVRRAELAEAERKRRERKLNGGGSTPTDPSARLRTIPRLFNSTTRPSTPVTGSPLPETSVATPESSQFSVDNIDIDLGDF